MNFAILSLAAFLVCIGTDQSFPPMLVLGKRNYIQLGEKSLAGLQAPYCLQIYKPSLIEPVRSEIAVVTVKVQFESKQVDE